MEGRMEIKEGKGREKQAFGERIGRGFPKGIQKICLG